MEIDVAKIRRVGGDPDERMADKDVERSRGVLDFYLGGNTPGLYWIHAVVWISRRRTQDAGIRAVQSLEGMYSDRECYRLETLPVICFYQMPRMACNRRLTQAMEIQQQSPVSMGLPPLLTR